MGANAGGGHGVTGEHQRRRGPKTDAGKDTMRATTKGGVPAKDDHATKGREGILILFGGDEQEKVKKKSSIEDHRHGIGQKNSTENATKKGPGKGTGSRPFLGGKESLKGRLEEVLAEGEGKWAAFKK